MIQAVVSILKFYATNKERTRGYAVEAHEGSYRVVFVEKTLDAYLLVGHARSRGKSHVYPSVFKADYAIRREILPLYQGAA
jgi:hypothetical protein